MKKITVFKEDHIMAVDVHDRNVGYGGWGESIFKCYGDDPIVTTREQNFKIHERRKGVSISKLNLCLENATNEILNHGFQKQREDSMTIYFEKSFKFIVMNEDLDEIISNSLAVRDQSTNGLENSSLQKLVEDLQFRVNSYQRRFHDFDILFRDSNKLIECIASTPWYKRIFRWKKSILVDKKSLEKQYRRIMKDEG